MLDRLADEALKATSFTWQQLIPPIDNSNEDDGPVEDEAELNLDRVEEEMAAEYSDEDEEEILHINELGNIHGGGGGLAAVVAAPQRPENILESNTDAEEWKMEVERVAPQLKA